MKNNIGRVSEQVCTPLSSFLFTAADSLFVVCCALSLGEKNNNTGIKGTHVRFVGVVISLVVFIQAFRALFCF